MKIVVDDKIPFFKGVFESVAEVVYLPGKDITQTAVSDADALLVRTRTRCDEKLLANTSVRFVGTATIGFDHIDTDFCKKHRIFWTNAPGCNADSVAQYVLSSLLYISLTKNISLSDKIVGIIGVGNVGQKVATLLQTFGMKVLLNDPPRSLKESGFVSLNHLLEASDIITFHTPLTYIGQYPTFHMADIHFFNKLKKKPIICNTARGEVIDTKGLQQAIERGKISDLILDCWENEPDIDSGILQNALLATPHIAGYSADGKANATKMIVRKLADYFHLAIDLPCISLPETAFPIIDLDEFPKNRIEQAILKTYCPKTDSLLLKNDPEHFEQFRNNYSTRREFKGYIIRHARPDEVRLLKGLGFQIEV